MTGRTHLRGSFENAIDMAIGAYDVHMRSCQPEGCQVVVKSGVRPIGGIVASRAIGTKSSSMLVILLMAGVAVHGCTLKTLGMAALAGYIHMFSFELKISQIVVKFCG